MKFLAHVTTVRVRVVHRAHAIRMIIIHIILYVRVDISEKSLLIIANLK